MQLVSATHNDDSFVWQRNSIATDTSVLFSTIVALNRTIAYVLWEELFISMAWVGHLVSKVSANGIINERNITRKN